MEFKKDLQNEVKRYIKETERQPLAGKSMRFINRQWKMGGSY
jgi:hypothetical protein